MTEHLTLRDVGRFRRGELSATEVVTLSRHLTACTDCSALARDSVDVDDAATSLRAALGIDDGEALRTALAASRAWRRKRFALIAAAAAVVVIAASIVMTRVEETPNRPPRITTSTPRPREVQGYGRVDWDSLVATARQSRRVPMPKVLRELRRSADVWRGTASDPSRRLHPTGEIVESQQPRFTWPAIADARYVVRIFDGDDEIVRSPRLAIAEWSPDRPLRRGVTYTWQVETGDRSVIMPSPPDPPALFRVIDAQAADEIAEARRRFPSDRVLLGILYARAGMKTPAAEELALHAAEHPEDAAAAELVASVRGW